jgi:hypothetical protein
MHMVKELITRAEQSGYSEVELNSSREAVLFRYAVKNYQRRHNVGEGLTTNAVGKTVTVRKQPEVRFKEPVE